MPKSKMPNVRRSKIWSCTAFCVPVSIRIAVLTGTIDSTSSLIDFIRTAKVIAAHVVDGSFLRVELSWFRTENGGGIWTSAPSASSNDTE
ncbi:hypothetical protein SAMN03159423_4911 [Bradyrhizobium sp. NFR13]|nr:hypothetical protein SAMN03159423_4911 [Bradyrhizobium sp. NFR13]